MFEDLEVRVERSELEPTRANPTDAGLDLRAKQDYTLPLSQRVLVDTGVQVKIPAGYVGLLVPRSSLSKQGIEMVNSIGIIDSDYRGNILAALMFKGNAPEMSATINALDRIVQLVIVPCALPQPLVRYVDDETWQDTSRGTGGFGSTGTT